jgi:curved DNA-binding protein CbpA
MRSGDAMTKSLYAVLNVAPDADPAVIEAAYKALMKKYHPDVLAGEPSADRRKAAEINEAFQILRDPDRRARYDHEERARQDSFRRAAAAKALAAAPPYVVQAPKRRKSRWPKLIVLLAAALALFLIWNESEEVRRAFGSETDAFAAQSPARQGRTGAVMAKDVDRAVAEFQRIKEETGLLGLSAFSQDCFADQSRLPTASVLDFCVAFDHAAADYDAQIAGDDLPQLPRFQPTELSIRHESAARLVSGDKAWVDGRLAQLRAMTTERLQPQAPEAQPIPIRAAQVSVPAKAKSKPRAHAARHARYQRGARRSGAAPRDREFLEREGYIY